MFVDYVHHDDTFKIARGSGLNAVLLVGIDEQAQAQRHLRFIQENIALSQGGLPAVKYLHEQWAETETLDTLGLG